MTYEWNTDYNRFAIARNILLQIVDSIYDVNNEVEFGVRLYGSEYPSQVKNCTDSKLLVPFNLQNVNQIKQSLLYTDPIGWSPIAYSLKQSAFGEINNTSTYDYSIIFITDGGESCGGDICKTFLELLEKKVSVTPYIIGLDNNETLKGYYECLGKYVSVLDTKDIPKAVKLIVNENRPILTKVKKLNLKTVFSNSPIKNSKPATLKVQIDTPTPNPIITRDKTVMSRLNPLLNTISKNTPKQPTTNNLSPLFQSLDFKFDFDLSKPKQFFDRLIPVKNFVTVNKPNEVNTLRVNPLFRKLEFNFTYENPKQYFDRLIPVKNFVTVSKPNEVNTLRVNPLFSKLEFNFTYDKPQPEAKMTKLRPFEPRHRFVYAFRIPRAIATRPLFQELKYTFNYSPIKRDTIVKRIGKPKPIKKPKATETNNGSNVNVSREVIPHNETLVQVFFVNKFQKKRMYGKATPTIVVKDANTNKEVKRFIRTVDRGAPEMKRIIPGTYKFMVKGDNSLITSAIRIDDNSINKVFIDVTDGTIEFIYPDNRERKMIEFQAIVNPRFDNGKTVIQECKDKLYYAPATYYVEINTLPTTRFAMVELDFGESKAIGIPEPGFVQINNTNSLGKVDFFHMLNDEYVRFHTIRVTGNIIDQKIQMQPPARGPYKAVFLKNPKVPLAGTKEVTFVIKSNQTTQLLLE